jgi:hypothetical protein
MAIFARKQDGKRSDARAKVETISVEIGTPGTDAGIDQAVVAQAAAARPADARVALDQATPVIAESATLPEPDVQPIITESINDATTASFTAPTAARAAIAATAAGGGTPAATNLSAAGTPATESVDIDEDIEPIDIGPAVGGPPAFGIGDAIQLMRSLPADPNIDLVVRVVRVTLGAVNVSIEEIMEDARRKEARVQGAIDVLESQVAELEKQVYARRCEIAAHQADLQETANVRERLYQADKYSGHRPPPAPPDAARVPHPPGRSADWSGPDNPKAGNG